MFDIYTFANTPKYLSPLNMALDKMLVFVYTINKILQYSEFAKVYFCKQNFLWFSKPTVFSRCEI